MPVPQLKNCIERAVILCEGDTLLPEHFRLSELHTPNIPVMNSDDGQLEGSFDLESCERRLIMKALENSVRLPDKKTVIALRVLPWQVWQE